jgi:hypothetical protein
MSWQSCPDPAPGQMHVADSSIQRLYPAPAISAASRFAVHCLPRCGKWSAPLSEKGHGLGLTDLPPVFPVFNRLVRPLWRHVDRTERVARITN